MSQNTHAESLFEDKFEDPSKWKFISDNVMGGLSTGSVVYEMTEGQWIAYLSGEFTTEHNGGFIQFRRTVKAVNFKEAHNVKINTKGKNEKYKNN